MEGLASLRPDLIARVLENDPDAPVGLIEQAYALAMQQHAGVKRASGEDYFSHPLRVATELANLGLDHQSVITGLLHDVVEDTSTTIEEIREGFGPEVARLVAGVTKLNEFELRSLESKGAENISKLLLAAADDLRIILVKLHDRLDNMRTLHFIRRPEKRLRIARETDDIYVPIANRLGMQDMKEELEDIAFSYIDPSLRESITRRTQALMGSDPQLRERIEGTLADMLAGAGISGEVSGRIKSPASIQKKLERKQVTLSALSDLIGFRLVLDKAEDCYRVLGLLHGKYQAVPGRIKDYISAPKANGYQSLHTLIVGPANQRIEVQIRTHAMHRRAEIGVAAHWHYKDKGSDKPNRGASADSRFMADLKAIIQASANPQEAMELARFDFYSREVFCYTPRSDIIKLPVGATCIDFAYAVHSDLGNKTVGAKVNGERRPLSFPLDNGDQVEILTSDGAEPQPQWEAIARTGKARSEIRRFARQAKRGAQTQAARQMLSKFFRANGYTLDAEAEGRAAAALNLPHVEDMLVQTFLSWLSLSQVLHAAYPASSVGQEAEGDTPSRIQPAALNDGRALSQALHFSIHGMSPGTVVTRAKCCQPLPGERIIGIRHAGSGIRIHTAHCDMLQNFGDTPELWLDVSWKAEGQADEYRYPARLHVTLFNRPGSMATLTGLIGQAGLNIANLNISKRELDFFEVTVDVEVENVRQVMRLVGALRGEDDIVKVDRHEDTREEVAEHD